MDTDVLVVGAGPTGLMLATELCLAGVRPVIVERQPKPRDTPKANGLAGQIVPLLRYRGLLERFAEHSSFSGPAPGFPFGGIGLDFTPLTESPLHLLLIPQPRLEELLAARATELGADIRRGHEVLEFVQDDLAVTVDIRGPDGLYQLTAGYLAGCDGGNSRIRDKAGIPFPGNTYPEVTRLGHVMMPESVTLLDSGDLDVPGLGTLRGGFTRTDRGVLALASFTPEVLLVSATEDDPTAYDPDAPVTLTELRDSIRRVLGAELPLGEPIWLTRFYTQARQAERYRDRLVFLAGDAAHLFPAGGAALNIGLLDAVNLAWKLAAAVHGWAPDDLLDTYHRERHLVGTRALLQTRAQAALARGHDADAIALRELFQELLIDEQPLRRIGALLAGTDAHTPLPDPSDHPLTGTFAPNLVLRTTSATTVADLMRNGRPLLLDLADRPDIRATAQQWPQRVDLHTATTDHRPADALLIRPDAQIAWAANIDQPTDTATTSLRLALSRWFGNPTKPPAQITDQPE
ncbi:FAD-dependent monooxygenase [Nocardia sp. CDC153]|uniref:FAD-dependent monooxygenase n=1 Tax=Nocardia sp. CDC153 TaxID=3112167 RepID=UPI002DBE1152|nr:FAD-dependent monooxygenase [Nocardia sp. CDC153]MEC3957845.1 FAD-dependent monooxygenase [Nocardia sp. CDC153]